MAHARRKFWDAHERAKAPVAKEALDRIAALYRIEDSIRGRPPNQRLRQEHTAPLMADLAASDAAAPVRTPPARSATRWRAGRR